MQEPRDAGQHGLVLVDRSEEHLCQSRCRSTCQAFVFPRTLLAHDARFPAETQPERIVFALLESHWERKTVLDLASGVGRIGKQHAMQSQGLRGADVRLTIIDK